jgi:hypothetical protein
VLGALRFLGYRLAAAGDTAPQPAPPPAVILETLGLGGFFEEIQPATPPVRGDAGRRFRELAAALRLAPVDILHVGADLQTDINAALAAGVRAAWLSPTATFRPTGGAVLLGKLADLPELFRLADTAQHQRPPDGRATRNLIALLRGVPEEAPAPRGRRHDEPERVIGELILEVAAELGTKAKPLDVLRRHWAEIVDKPNLASASEPESISPTGTLKVHCANTIVRTELQTWRMKQILAAVLNHAPCRHVKKIVFCV